MPRLPTILLASGFSLLCACGGGGGGGGSAEHGDETGTGDDDDGSATVPTASDPDATASAGSDDDGESGGVDTGDGDSDDDGGDPLCGNGELDPGEECDDHNTDDDDWCTGACVVATCGDGIVWAAAETCDDRNHDDGDGCSATCVLETCGDGVLDEGEQCDLGPNNATQGALCSEACVSAGVALAASTAYDLEWDDAHGRMPTALRSGDVNGDGHGDVVTGNRGTGGATIVYGFGDGTMWTPFSMDLVQQTTAVAVGDFDGDGRDDVATTLLSPSRVAIALGQDRVVGEPETIDLLVAPRGLAAGDVDDDGDVDLVVANDEAGSVTVLEGDGAGDFAIAGSPSTIAGGGGLGPWAVAIGDVTGDAIVDIVTANRDSSDVTVFAGTGGGALGIAQTFALGGVAPEAIALADLDGDGVLDVVTADAESDEISVLVADGAGGFGVANEFASAGARPRGLAVGDVDGDGAIDVVAADSDADAISVWLGIPGGGALGLATGFDVSQPDVPFIGSVWAPVGRGPTRVALADLDGDDDLDVVTSNGRSKDLTVLLGDGAGGFDMGGVYEYLPSWRSTQMTSDVALALGDLDDDGRVDVAVADALAHSLDVVAGDGRGRLLPSISAEYGYVDHWWDHRDVALGDIDGNGRLDFATSRGSYDGHAYGEQLPSGGFYFVSNGASGDTFGAALADFDDDGHDDVFLGLSGGVSVYPWENGSFAVGLGTMCESVLAADATGDGLVDLLVADAQNDAVLLAAGTGTPEFGGANPISTLGDEGGVAPAWVVAHELSGDAHLDLVTANRNTGDVSVMLGLGNGAFAPAETIALGAIGESTRVRVGDFNGDLRPDLVVTGEDAERIFVLVGFANGSFASPQDSPIGAPGLDVEAIDLDGDGIADVVTTGVDAIEVHPSDGHVVL
jgi:cysteine-rich repeat protein